MDIARGQKPTQIVPCSPSSVCRRSNSPADFSPCPISISGRRSPVAAGFSLPVFVFFSPPEDELRKRGVQQRSYYCQSLSHASLIECLYVVLFYGRSALLPRMFAGWLFSQSAFLCAPESPPTHDRPTLLPRPSTSTPASLAALGGGAVFRQQAPTLNADATDVEVVPNPVHVHVLEVLPPPEKGEEEGGRAEKEGRRVEVDPSIGKFLLVHQVTRTAGGGGGGGEPVERESGERFLGAGRAGVEGETGAGTVDRSARMRVLRPLYTSSSIM